MKIVMIGDVGVGKTTFMHCWADGQRASIPGQYRPGVDSRHKAIRLDGREVDVQLWDTAGQEQFGHFPTSFYRDAAGILLMFDVGNRASFESARDAWAREISRFALVDSRMLLVGLKANESEPAHSARRREVSPEEGALLAVSLSTQELRPKGGQVRYVECSSQSGEGVDQAMSLLASFALESNPSHPAAAEGHA